MANGYRGEGDKRVKLINNLNLVSRLSFISTSHYIVKGQYPLSFVYRLICPAGLLYNGNGGKSSDV
jgi:hypothetical protein